MSAGLGLLPRHAREVFTCVSDEGLKMLRNFAVKMRELKLWTLDFLLIELRDKAAHVFEVCRRMVYDVLDKCVSLLIEIFRTRKGKGRPQVRGSRVVPESYIGQRDFMPKRGLVGDLAWRHKFERDLRECAESDGKKFRGLSGIIPWGSDIAGKPVSNLGVYSLQGLDLGLDANQRGLDAAFGILALCVEIHGLPDCDASQDYGYDACNKTDRFHDSPEKPN